MKSSIPNLPAVSLSRSLMLGLLFATALAAASCTPLLPEQKLLWEQNSNKAELLSGKFPKIAPQIAKLVKRAGVFHEQYKKADNREDKAVALGAANDVFRNSLFFQQLSVLYTQSENLNIFANRIEKENLADIPEREEIKALLQKAQEARRKAFHLLHTTDFKTIKTTRAVVYTAAVRLVTASNNVNRAKKILARSQRR